MRYRLPQEFEELLAEYNASDNMEIKEKLNKIVACYGECSPNERVFADAIAVLFSRIVRILEKQKPENNISSQAIDSPIPFSNGDEMRVAFYNYFRNEQKKSSDKKVEYPEIHSLEQLKGSDVNTTMRDYVARIQTFTKGYLWNVPRLKEIYDKEASAGYVDPILFTYKHLELILASFETKDYSLNGERVINKQKNNIRSALRKLNDFKQNYH